MTHRSNRHFEIFYLLLAFGVLTIPFSIFFQLPIIILLVINFIAEWNWKEKYNNLTNNGLKTEFLIFSIFTAVYLLGVTYSSNLRYAFSDLECKLFLFLMPFVIFTQKKENFTKDRVEKLFFLFILSVILLIITNFTISTCNFVKRHDIHQFLYSRLSHFTHPSYSALYATTAFLLILHFLFINPVKEKKWKILLWLGLPLTVIYIFALQSKAGLLVFLLTALADVLYIINRKQRRIAVTLCFLISCMAIIIVMAKFTPVLERMGQAVRVATEGGVNEASQESTGIRVIAWREACAVGLRQPVFGVGTGDVKDTLVAQYEAQGFTYMAQKGINAHNQYLQTFIALGFIGLLSLIAALIFPMANSIRQRNFTAAIWWFAIICNLLVECMFEIRAGSDFIATFGCLLCYYVNVFDRQERAPVQIQQ